jgi:alpha,alpha-trehalase
VARAPAPGLLFRYLPDESPDGLSGEGGAFVLCSFWMIDNLSQQGRIDEAYDRFERMYDRTNDLGLLPEEIDPTTGEFLGNFPQAYSHLGLISSGFNLERATIHRAMVTNGLGGKSPGDLDLRDPLLASLLRSGPKALW